MNIEFYRPTKTTFIISLIPVIGYQYDKNDNYKHLILFNWLCFAITIEF